MNRPLARALRSAGMEPVDVAARLRVDPKTVHRWLAGRVPYPRNQVELARLTGWTVHDLWPQSSCPAAPDRTDDEVRVVYPHRSAVPVDAWRRLFERADREISILAYAALNLAENATAMRALRDRARAGVRVRILLGDPDGRHVVRRGDEEQIGQMMAARIRNALILFKPLCEQRGVGLRLHDTVLYNSIYRGDDEILVNAHVLGCPAAYAPVLHLRQACADGTAAMYVMSFERVWTAAQPINR